MILKGLFGPFPVSKMLQNDPPELFLGPDLGYNRPKSLKNQPWPPQGPPRDTNGRPEASRHRFGSLFCSFLGPFGLHFRTPQRLHSGSDVTLLPRLPSLLLSTSSFLTLSFLSFLRSLASPPPKKQRHERNPERKQPRNSAAQKPTHLGSAGARVSAYN